MVSVNPIWVSDPKRRRCIALDAVFELTFPVGLNFQPRKQGRID